MNGILSIVQSISATGPDQLPILFSILEEHQCFQHKPNNELEPIVSLISNYLNEMASKHQGLLLLNAFLNQCPLDIFEQKGALWITMCTKVCDQKKPVQSINLAFEVLAKLTLKSVHVPELGKAMSNNLLAKIMENTVGLPAGSHLAALKFLEVAMQTYPGAAGLAKMATEKFIVSFVDSQDRSLVVQSAKCLQLLQQTRGGGTQSQAHKVAWSQMQLALLGSLHELMDALYSNTSEFVDAFAGPERLSMLELQLSDEPVARAMQLVTRFKNLCKYLHVLLIEPFHVAKAIQPAKILSLISRGLAVNCSTLAANLITDNIALGALLPEIHIALFELLDAMILVLRGNMLMYGKSVCQLVIQSLKWTSSGRAAGSKRPYASIRKAAYRTLDEWCKSSTYGSGVEAIADDLVQQILLDVTPYQNAVTLKVLSGSKKHLSKKARKTLQKAQNDATNMAQTHSKAFNPHNTKVVCTDEGNEPLCSAALNCLIDVLLASGCFLKPVMHKMLQEHIVALAAKVIESPSLKSNLYASAECRIKLYGVLHALIVSSHHLCPPPVQYAATLFNVVQVRDASPRVREWGATYLRLIEKILHPQKEILYFMAELNDVRDALQGIKKKVIGNEYHDDHDSDSNNDDEEELHFAVDEQTLPDAQSSTVDAVVTSNDITKEIDRPVTPLNVSDENIVQIDIDREDDLLKAPVSQKTDNSEVINITEDNDHMETLALADSSDENNDDHDGSNVIVDITGATTDNYSSRKKRKSSKMSSAETIDISDDEDVLGTDKSTPAKQKSKKSKVIHDEGNEEESFDDFISSFNDELNANLK